MRRATSSSVISRVGRSITIVDKSGRLKFGRTSTSNSYSKSPSSGSSMVSKSKSGSLIGSSSCVSATCSRLSTKSCCLI